MKRILAMLLILLLVFSGCSETENTGTLPTGEYNVAQEQETVPAYEAPEYVSRFDSETVITLSDTGIETDAEGVFTSNDIIYYEDKDFYESGNPYGEGQEADKHTAEEAAAHTVVNITKPGAYRVTGKLSAGQIRVDLGEDAYEDETAVVELILDSADITCTVAPAILFLNVYECDGAWSEETAQPAVDTAAAGANLVLEGENTVNGAYVARIYKDKEGEKKLWKQDGAIYSYMSMNVFGPGSLELNATNEGLDTELHLTVNGGKLTIRSGNDGINTNEDNVSVTTINGGDIHIIAGLGAEGDGIDSNGYLVIRGGRVIAAAHPAADAGLDSDLGSYIHGGTVIALGSTMDWAESDSGQVTMNLQFAQYQNADAAIRVTGEDGAEVFSYDPAADEVLGTDARQYMGAVISCPEFKQGETYLLNVDGQQMQYTGTDVRSGPGGFGGFGGDMPDNTSRKGADGGKSKWPEGNMPDNAPPEGLEPTWPEGERPEPPEGFGGQRHEGAEGPGGQMSDRFGGPQQSGVGNTLFHMQDKVNCFSGICPVDP